MFGDNAITHLIDYSVNITFIFYMPWETKKFIWLALFRYSLCFHFFFNIHFERQTVRGGGAESEGDTESKLGSSLGAVNTEPDVGLELTDRELMT